MRESSLERKCGQLVKHRGGESIKLLSLAGLPDRLVLLPCGVVLFIEFKTEKGRISKLQNWWGRRLQFLGFQWHVIRDEKTFIEVLNDVQTASCRRSEMPRGTMPNTRPVPAVSGYTTRDQAGVDTSGTA